MALFFYSLVATAVGFDALGYVIEDAEDSATNRWVIYSGKSRSGSIQNTFDPVLASQVIELKSSNGSTSTGFKLLDSNLSDIHDYSILRWKMKSQRFIFYVFIDTLRGKRYLKYVPEEFGKYSRKNSYLKFGLGAQAADGSWHNHTRDLRSDLQTLEPDNDLVSVLSVLIRGSLSVDDLRLEGSGAPVQAQDFSAQLPQALVDASVASDSATTHLLNGSSSTGNGLTYQWQQVSGSPVVLTNQNAAVAQFTTPVLDRAETLDFQLTVTDAFGQSDSGIVSVRVQGLALAENRYESLLSQRFGYGAETTGGYGGVDTLITSLTDDSLLNALTDDVARWIYFDPSLSGKTWKVPRGSIDIGPNKTVDGRDVSKITWQFGEPDTINGSEKPALDWAFNLRKGNTIIHCITFKGDMQYPVEFGSNFNGPTDGIRIFDGKDYWIHGNTFTRMSDEANSLTQLPASTAKPDSITQSYNLFLENKNGSIVGSNKAAGSHKPKITQAYNYYLNQADGRSPGMYFNVQAHVINNLVRGYTSQSMFANSGSYVIAEHNIIEPGCVSGVHSLHNSKGSGRMYVNGDWASQGGCKKGHDGGYSTASKSAPFSVPSGLPYKNYTLLSDYSDVESHVINRAGANMCDRSF